MSRGGHKLITRRPGSHNNLRVMLPETLLSLLNVAVVVAQSRQALSLNSVSSFNPRTLPNPPSFSLPVSSILTVSVALCSNNSAGFIPRFFVTNSSTVNNPGSSGGPDVFEVPLNGGHGNWTGVFPDGGVLAVENVANISFEVGVSDKGELGSSDVATLPCADANILFG